MKYRLKVESQDDQCFDPRDVDNVGTMLCWHRRYSLGDNNPWKDDSVEDALLSLISEHNPEFEEQLEEWYDAESDKIPLRGRVDQTHDLSDRRRQRIEDEFNEHYVSLPLYLYDHSGITMRTSGFGCPWDSGQVGFIYVSKRRAVHQLTDSITGADWETRWDTELEKKTIDCLKSEVKVYDQYITGDVYGFTLERVEYEFEQPEEEVNVKDDTVPWQEVDSCWGFYGSDIDESGMLDHLGEHRRDALKKAFYYVGDWVECPADLPVAP